MASRSSSQKVVAEMEKVSAEMEELKAVLKETADPALTLTWEQRLAALQQQLAALQQQLAALQQQKTLLLQQFAGFLLAEYLVQPQVLDTVKRSVFLLQDGADTNPVGVGVFFAPRLAVTANHNLLQSTREGSQVTATFGCDSPRKGETLQLVVVHRSSEADFALLQTIDEQSACLAPYTGRPEHLQTRSVALCCYQLGIAPDLGPMFGSLPSLGTMRGTVVKLSPRYNHLVVQSDAWPGDSGAAVIVSNGELVGILIEGVNSLRDRIERHATLNEPLNEVEQSLAQAAQSVASGCIVLSHQVFVECAKQLGLLPAA